MHPEKFLSLGWGCGLLWPTGLLVYMFCVATISALNEWQILTASIIFQVICKNKREGKQQAAQAILQVKKIALSTLVILKCLFLFLI